MGKLRLREIRPMLPSKQTAESGREQGSCWYQGGRGGHASGQIAGGGDLTCPVPLSLPAPAQAQRKLGGGTPGEISPTQKLPRTGGTEIGKFTESK